MDIEEATRLERHIMRIKSAYKPQISQIGNGEWTVLLKGKRDARIWSAEDYENFEGRPVQQEEQVVV